MADEEVVQKIEPETNKEPQNKKKSNWKYVLNIFIVLIVSAVAVFLAVYKDFNTIVSYLFSSDYRFILVIVGLMMSYILVRGFMFFCFARLFTRDYKFHQGIAVEYIGTFYAAVTPGGQGGEVMQAYTYKKQGIQISSAVSALAMLSILHQIILILFGVVSFIAKYDFIIVLPNAKIATFGEVTIELPMWALTILGFGLNVGYIGIILAMSYWRGFHNFIMGPIISFLHKIKIVKNPDKSRENLRTQIQNFKIESKRLFSNAPFTILISFLLIISMSIKFSIPYFVGLAMGNQSTCASFWDAVFLSNYHQMATGLIPIPGSAGVSEFVFNSLFSTSPAFSNTSFYFIETTEEQQINVYNAILNNPSKYFSFFRAIAGKINPNVSARDFADSLERTVYGLIDSGTEFANLDDPDFKQAVIYYANTQASSAMASAALVLWRFATFIAPLVIAGFVTAFYRASPRGNIEEKDNKMAGRETIVALRRETYSDRAAVLETMLETSRLNRENIYRRLKALSNNDKKKKKKMERDNIADPDLYDDMTIDDGDDSNK